jgi:hypothetical protein
MKKIFLKLMIIPLLLIVAVGFASCGDKEPEEKFPVEVPFTEYSLEGTSCAWKPLEYRNEPNSSEIAVINSDEELQNYLVCTEGSLPEIDFDKYTLLFTQGMSTQGIKNITKQLIRNAQDKYNLDVNITQNMTMKPEKWEVAIIVSKLPESSVVTLNVNTNFK